MSTLSFILVRSDRLSEEGHQDGTRFGSATPKSTCPSPLAAEPVTSAWSGDILVLHSSSCLSVVLSMSTDSAVKAVSVERYHAANHQPSQSHGVCNDPPLLSSSCSSSSHAVHYNILSPRHSVPCFPRELYRSQSTPSPTPPIHPRPTRLPPPIPLCAPLPMKAVPPLRPIRVMRTPEFQKGGTLSLHRVAYGEARREFCHARCLYSGGEAEGLDAEGRGVWGGGAGDDGLGNVGLGVVVDVAERGGVIRGRGRGRRRRSKRRRVSASRHQHMTQPIPISLMTVQTRRDVRKDVPAARLREERGAERGEVGGEEREGGIGQCGYDLAVGRGGRVGIGVGVREGEGGGV